MLHLYDDLVSLVKQFCETDLLAGSRVFLFKTLQAPLSMGILQARILEWAAMPSSEIM